MREPPHDMFCFTAHGPSGGAKDRHAFARDVEWARAAIRGAPAVCNLQTDRYAFATHLAAALLNGQPTILPPSRAALAVKAAIAHSAPGAIVLDDATQPAPSGATTAASGATPDALRQALSRAAGEIHVFTSGSTGDPIRHIKTWETLAGGAAVTNELLRWAGVAAAPLGIIGTTPQQHMYGLEATIFAALAFDRPIYTGMVFFPADLERAVAAAGACGLETSVLVTTPAHLRFLEPTVRKLAAIRLVISATAPLPVEQAVRLEAGGDRMVLEIYGSTETGSLAGRRTTTDALWTPLAGFELRAGSAGEGVHARAPHLHAATALNDAVEIAPDGRFRLLGRLGEQVQVAGKRTTLGALNAALADAPGLRDGVIVRRKHDAGDELALIGVLDDAATTHTARGRIRQHLLARIDAVFVPSRMLFVSALPRAATGKLAGGDMARLAEQALGPRAV